MMFRNISVIIFILNILITNEAYAKNIPSHIISRGHATCIYNSDILKCEGNIALGSKRHTREFKNIKTVSIGGSHSYLNHYLCLIDDDGVKCLGEDELLPEKKFSNPKGIAAGPSSACAIDDSGVHCWGRDDIEPPKHILNPTSIAAGGRFGVSKTRNLFCVIDDGLAKCWDDFGEINVPENIKNVKQISIGSEHICARSEEKVWCWGNNSKGQIVVPANLKNPNYISAGDYHSCVIDDEGVKCWGGNSNGQTNVPDNIAKAYHISAGRNNTCVLTHLGSRCWGDKKGLAPDSLVNPSKIAITDHSTCVLDDEGMKCWGKISGNMGNKYSSLLSNYRNIICALEKTAKDFKCWGEHWKRPITSKHLYKNVKIKNIKQATFHFTNDSTFFCFLDDDSEKEVKCSGLSRDEVYVHGQTRPPADLKGVKSIAANRAYVCAIDTEGLKCWGYGGLDIPPNIINPRNITAGSLNTCLIDDAGIKCWGNEGWGINNVPGNLKNPIKISIGHYNACAVDDEGLKCWGHDKAAINSALKDLKNVKDVGVQGRRVCAVYNNKLKCWAEGKASNTYGEAEPSKKFGDI